MDCRVDQSPAAVRIQDVLRAVAGCNDGVYSLIIVVKNTTEPRSWLVASVTDVDSEKRGWPFKFRMEYKENVSVKIYSFFGSLSHDSRV